MAPFETPFHDTEDDETSETSPNTEGDRPLENPFGTEDDDASDNPFNTEDDDASDNPFDTEDDDASDNPFDTEDDDASDNPFDTEDDDASDNPFDTEDDDASDNPFDTEDDDASDNPFNTEDDDASDSPYDGPTDPSPNQIPTITRGPQTAWGVTRHPDHTPTEKGGGTIPYPIPPTRPLTAASTHPALSADAVGPDWATAIGNACEEWVIGQGHAIRTLWLSVLAGGHALIQGPAGTGKSVLCHTLVSLLGLPTHTMSFTSDLSPKDLIGSVVYDPDQHEWVPHVGPLFTHAVLIDDVNRAPGTVQSALLTAMSHRHITIHRHTYPLPHPFVVMATQTPDRDGTYPLCDSLMDRWMVSVAIGYPSLDAERQLIKKSFDAPAPPTPITTPDHLALAQSAVATVYIDDRLIQHIVQLVTATRRPDIMEWSDLTPLIERGASPRASQALVAMAKAAAWMDHRTYVIPDDIKAVVKSVLRHRVAVSYDAHAQAITPDLLIDQLMVRLPIS